MVQFPTYSQTYLPGYLALKRLEFRDYFDRNHVQLRCRRGIWCSSTSAFPCSPHQSFGRHQSGEALAGGWEAEAFAAALAAQAGKKRS